MVHFKRVVGEQISLLFSIGVSLADRIVLTAVLFRFWGSELFGAWSAAVALAGLAALFELGFNMYFNNRLMIEVEQGRLADARRTYFMSNFIFVGLGIASFLLMVVFVTVLQPPDTESGSDVTIAALIIAAATAARIGCLGPSSLYRAHRRYARLVMIQTAGEGARITAAIVAVMLGGGLVAVSIASTAMIVAVQVCYMFFDSQRRFHPHQFAVVIPSRKDLRDLALKPTAFLAQTAPITLLTSLPVVVLLNGGLETALLAGFVLVRTLSGLPRLPLQAFGIVIGQECGRRLAVNDLAGASLVLKEGARLFGVMSGLCVGILIAGGTQIVSIWTGEVDFFQQDQLIAAVLPMILVAESVLAHNVLAASNAPYLAAAGRWAQMGLTAIIAFIPTGIAPALQMQIALSLGEIFGFAPFAYIALARLVPGTGVSFHFRALIFTLGSAIIGGGITHIALWAIGFDRIVEAALALVISLSVCALLLPWLGLNGTTRQKLIDTIRPKLTRLFGQRKARHS